MKDFFVFFTAALAADRVAFAGAGVDVDSATTAVLADDSVRTALSAFFFLRIDGCFSLAAGCSVLAVVVVVAVAGVAFASTAFLVA